MATKTFRKTMLRAGQTFHSPDGEVKVTPERLQHWADTFRKMSGAGQVIPMHWDHGSELQDLTPLTLSEFKQRKSRSAKNTVGHLKRFDVAEDGQSAEVEFVTLSAHATEAMEQNRVNLSPVILSQWKDGAGNQYTDAITHLDFVDHAVDHSQTPAEEVEAICCSLRMSDSSHQVVKVFRMASDEPPDEDGDYSDYSEGSNAEETSAGGEATVGRTLDLLARLDIVLPGDTDAKNFIDRLYTALLTAVASEEDPMADQSSQDTEVVDPQIATMSLQARQALAYGERQHRATVQKDLDELLASGRCTPAEHKARQESIGAIKLSLDSDGNPTKSETESWIESRKPVPEGTFWSSDEKLRRMSLEAAPADTGGVDPEEAADFVLGKK